MSEAEVVQNNPNGFFFLHHSDHPNLLLVSKRLNGDNYHSWCRAMEISLSAKNKTGFITGKITEPDDETEPEEHALWQRCNDIVLSWILHSIEPDLVDTVLSCITPRAIWEDLRERFSQGNATHVFQIQRDIYRIEQDQMTVATYYTKLKGLWDELSSYCSLVCTCRAQNDRTRLMQFLMGLNETYASTRGQVFLMNPLPSVRQAYASVCQEEKQRELGSSGGMTSNLSAMVVKGSNNDSRFKRYNSGTRSDEPFKCTYCDKDFHREANCWKKHGYPPGHPKHKNGGADFEGNNGRSY